jgi:sulfur transfer protein SufE
METDVHAEGTTPHSPLPAKLIDVISSTATRSDRIQILIDLARRYQDVPEQVAERPSREKHQVPDCDSGVYALFDERPDATLRFRFAVGNPNGISAKALAVILDETLSGVPLDQVSNVSTDVVYEIFGNDLSMRKRMGLRAMVGMVVAEAKRRLTAPTHTRSSRTQSDQSA